MGNFCCCTTENSTPETILVPSTTDYNFAKPIAASDPGLSAAGIITEQEKEEIEHLTSLDSGVYCKNDMVDQKPVLCEAVSFENRNRFESQESTALNGQNVNSDNAECDFVSQRHNSEEKDATDISDGSAPGCSAGTHLQTSLDNSSSVLRSDVAVASAPNAPPAPFPVEKLLKTVDSEAKICCGSPLESAPTSTTSTPSALTPRTRTRAWEKKHVKTPLYSSGGPYNAATDKDSFSAPEIGDACYLVFNTTNAGTLKLLYATSPKTVSDRIIAGCKLATAVPSFKFKKATQLETNVNRKVDKLYRGIGAIIRASRQHHGEVQFYALPPGFAPFAVLYRFADDTVRIQFPGDPPVYVDDTLATAAVTNVKTANTLVTASKIAYPVFKLQFAHCPTTSLLDFQRDLTL